MINRIKNLLLDKKLTATQLAELIGVQRSGISHILSGRNKPSLDFIVKLIEQYPELNTEWLLLGKGEMYLGDKKIDKTLSVQQTISGIVDENTSEDNSNSKVTNVTVNNHTENNNNTSEKQPIKSEEIKTNDRLKSNITFNKDEEPAKIFAFYDDGTFEIFHRRT